MSTPGQVTPATGGVAAAVPPPPNVQRRRPNESGGLFQGKKKNKYAQPRVTSGNVGAGVPGTTANSETTQPASQQSSTSEPGVARSSARPTNPALGNPPQRAVTPIPGRLVPGGSGISRPTPGTPSQSVGRSGSTQGSPRTSGTTNATSSTDPAPAPAPARQTYQDFPIYLLPRVASTNPTASTDPLLRALPFPTSLNVIHIRHPGSATLPLPDLSAPAGQLYLNRKDPSAPPPPDPRILQERNEERERIARVKTPVQQPDGTWRVRMWDWANKGEKKDENGETVWREAADPAMIAPDLVEKAPVDKWKNKNKKGKYGKKGGGGGGGGGGKKYGGGKSSGPAGEGRVNVKMREQALMYRQQNDRHDLPSETSSGSEESEEEQENGNDDEPLGSSSQPADDGEAGASGKGKKGSKKKAAALNANAGIGTTEEEPPKPRKVKGKTYRRTMAIANARNREKNPFVLEGHFGTEPMLPVPLTPAVPPPGTDPDAAPVPAVPERQKLRYVSNAISDVKDRYVALLFNGSDVGLRWVGREYTFGVRTEEKREEREGQEGGGRRWGPRGSRRGQAAANGAPNPADAAAAAAAIAAGGNTDDVDMELYRPGSASSGADVKPHLQDTGDNPDAFPRMLAGRGGQDIKPKIEVKSDPDRGRGRGRGRDTKPLAAQASLMDKLNRYEGSAYNFAKAGSGRDIDEYAADEIYRQRQRARRGVQKWDDDDLETRGRRGGVGRGVSRHRIQLD